MSVTKKEIEHLAKLARLELTDAEKEKFSKDISSILQYLSKLQELRVDLNLIDSLTTSKDSIQPPREDKVIGKSSGDQQKLIKQAPESEDNLIKTKPVFY